MMKTTSMTTMGFPRDRRYKCDHRDCPQEPLRDKLEEASLDADQPRISAASLVEFAAVLIRRLTPKIIGAWNALASRQWPSMAGRPRVLRAHTVTSAAQRPSWGAQSW